MACRIAAGARTEASGIFTAAARAAALMLFTTVPALACGGASGEGAPPGADASMDVAARLDSGSPRNDSGGSSNETGAPTDGNAPESGKHRDAGDTDAGPLGGLHVVMGKGGAPGHIVNGAGTVVQLHGADRSGTEFECLGGTSFFDGPADQAGLDAMKAWNIDAVRVPLNADCWLNVNGVPSGYGGAPYQSAITTWVNLITSNGMVAIVDLHWTAPGTYTANAQTPMADNDHAPMFWSQVAKTFAGNSSVIFDLFNEPYITDWGCWLTGGSCAQWDGSSATGASYDVAGMATLLQAVRKAGADNVVILGGLGYSSDMSQWVKSVASIPTLPTPLNGISIKNVAASWHVYDFGSEQTGCPSQYNSYTGTCNTAAVTAMNTSATDVLSAGYPVLIGEAGISAYDTGSAGKFSPTQITDLENWFDGILTYMEGQGQSYLAWSWNVDTAPILLMDYTGTPSIDFGVTYKAHLAKF